MESRKTRGVGIRLLVHQVVDIALAIDGDRLAPMPCHLGKTHEAKQPMQFHGLGMGKLYERKAVGSHRVLRADCGWWRIMWERSHLNSLLA
jgi:hypothetical protein